MWMYGTISHELIISRWFIIVRYIYICIDANANDKSRITNSLKILDHYFYNNYLGTTLRQISP